GSGGEAHEGRRGALSRAERPLAGGHAAGLRPPGRAPVSLRRGSREAAVIGRIASRISSSLTGMALITSFVGLAPVVGSFSESRYVSGPVLLRIHWLTASIASGVKENLSWPTKTALAITSFAFAAWRTSRPQAA